MSDAYPFVIIVFVIILAWPEFHKCYYTNGAAMDFKIVSDYKMRGDQPEAVES